ncbi:MAG: 2-C-methyl-D-erythritol 4-phosphate cytidylyltransferase [Actinomycetota bacterium]
MTASIASPTGATWTIIVAAGSGSRFGGPVPKQFVEVAGRRIVDWSIAAARAVSDGVVVVLPPGGEFGIDHDDMVSSVIGGDSRSESVRRGLAVVPDRADVVLVHDAARPVASIDLFSRVADAVRGGADGVVPSVPVVDTLRSVDGTPVDRSTLVAVQTPQGFAPVALRAAHATRDVATDDATLVTLVGGKVVSVDGERWNLKVTDPDDERVAAVLLSRRA